MQHNPQSKGSASATQHNPKSKIQNHMIPQQIHQTWRTRHLPARLMRYHTSWARHNPTWRIYLYDDQACLDFVRRHYPWLMPVYQGFAYNIQRADLFRYLIIYHYGGLYADIDMECLRPLDRLDPDSTAIFSVEALLMRQRQHELGYAKPFQVANCIFAAEPRHWFLALIIACILQRAHQPVTHDAEIEELTGPRLVTRLYFALPPTLQQRLRLLPQICWMAPTSYPNLWPLNMNMFARHHFMGSWKTQATKSGNVYRRWIERSRLPHPWPSAGR